MTGSTIHWRKRARCIGTDPNTFFNEDPSPALEICEDCEVRTECLEFAPGQSVGVGLFRSCCHTRRGSDVIWSSSLN
ncbi:WhiB family transcriptional regulator [Candidatus Hakubella thermalkaliphila]